MVYPAPMVMMYRGTTLLLLPPLLLLLPRSAFGGPFPQFMHRRSRSWARGLRAAGIVGLWLLIIKSKNQRAQYLRDSWFNTLRPRLIQFITEQVSEYRRRPFYNDVGKKNPHDLFF